MAQLWCTGPAEIYAAPPGTSPGQALFLGTCEDKPDIEIDDRWLEIHNDLGGKSPFDKSFQGQIGMFVGDLNNVKYPILQAVCTVPNTAAALATQQVGGAVPVGGINVAGDIGTLALTENQAYYLYVIFPYFNAKPSMLALDNRGGPVNGYLFPGAITNKETISGMGTGGHKKRLIVDLLRPLDMTQSNAFGRGTFLLYRTDAGVIPVPFPVAPI